MGLKDRLKAAKAYVKSPLEVRMLDRGSDVVVRAGEPATVVVEVAGESDASVEGIALSLRVAGVIDGAHSWPLGEVPSDAGTHSLAVAIPTGLAPTSQFSRYSFAAEVTRTRGVGADAASPVAVIARPQDLYWPDGPRAGQDGPADPGIEITLAQDTANLGGTVSGTVVLRAAGDTRAHAVELQVGPVVDTPLRVAGHATPQPTTRFLPGTELRLGESRGLRAGDRLELPFTAELLPGLPPTLDNGDRTQVVWQVRVSHGPATGWRLVGVLDPDALSGLGNERAAGLIALLT